MAEGWLYAALTMLLWTAVAALYRRAGGGGLLELGAALSLLGLLGATALLAGRLPLIGLALRAPPFLLLMLAAGVLNQASMLLLARAMSRGPAAVVWTIGQSAMVLPFLFSVLFWGERAGPPQWLGLAAAIGALALLAGPGPAGPGLRAAPPATRSAAGPPSPPGPAPGWLPLSLAAFAAIGAGQLLFMVPSYLPGWRTVLPARVWVGQLGAAAFFWAACALRGARPGARPAAGGRPPGRALRPALPLSLGVVAGQVTFFAAADRFAALGMGAVTFPAIVAGSIVGVGLYSGLFLGERYGARRLLGVALGLAGIGCISWR